MREPVEIQPEFPSLLNNDEPPAWELHNPNSTSPLVILCDHARNRIPHQLNGLGLNPDHLENHIGYDIGAMDVSQRLSQYFESRLFLAGYSRLVIDLNRHPGDGSSIPEVSDEIEIPANWGLTPEDIIQRENALFWPYHNAVTKELEAIHAQGQTPVILSLHSFTPTFRGFQRPWQIGVLWDQDQRISKPLIDRLSQLPDICVGDNEPYHARHPLGFTMDVHCERNGYPHILLELRQDLIDDGEGAAHWADLIYQHLKGVLIDLDLLKGSEEKE